MKSTGGSYLPSVELTANEWRAAEKKRRDYRIALVSSVRSANPKIQFIEDPFGKEADGRFEVEPLSWRLTRREV